MLGNILVFLPIIVLVVTALLTKKMAESMIAAALFVGIITELKMGRTLL